jgi:hypothetical protein
LSGVAAVPSFFAFFFVAASRRSFAAPRCLAYDVQKPILFQAYA